jgi:hypothetical protein
VKPAVSTRITSNLLSKTTNRSLEGKIMKRLVAILILFSFCGCQAGNPVQVSQPRHVGTNGEFFGFAIASVDVTNVGESAFSSISGRLAYYADGRTIPHCQGWFETKIPGGIEPGESQEITIQIGSVRDVNYPTVDLAAIEGKWLVQDVRVD